MFSRFVCQLNGGCDFSMWPQSTLTSLDGVQLLIVTRPHFFTAFVGRFFDSPNECYFGNCRWRSVEWIDGGPTTDGWTFCVLPSISFLSQCENRPKCFVRWTRIGRQRCVSSKYLWSLINYKLFLFFVSTVNNISTFPPKSFRETPEVLWWPPTTKSITLSDWFLSAFDVQHLAFQEFTLASPTSSIGYFSNFLNRLENIKTASQCTAKSFQICPMRVTKYVLQPVLSCPS